MSASPSDAELQFYYAGLHKVLRRHRFMTVLGWVVTLAGVASIPIGWQLDRPQAAIDLVLAGGIVIAGLALVQQSIASLESYVTVPFPPSSQEEGGPGPHAAIRELAQLMREIDEGGWQEAYEGIRRVEAVGAAHGLPPLQ